MDPENQEYFLFLNRLRESGVTNMWGSPAHLAEWFDLDEKEARTIVSSWMTWVTADPKNRDK